MLQAVLRFEDSHRQLRLLSYHSFYIPVSFELSNELEKSSYLLTNLSAENSFLCVVKKYSMVFKTS